MKRWIILAGFLLVARVAFVVALVAGCTASPHRGEASWTLQGQTSLPGCPGQHATRVDIDGQSYFLECY
jgi:hypothetical protein